MKRISRRQSHPRKQRGVILIVAMFVVVLVTILVTSVSWKYTLNMARYENRWYGMVGDTYLEGAEEIAKKFLVLDIEQGQEADHVAEEWNLGPMPFEIDEGGLQMSLFDAQGFFNINALQEKRVLTDAEKKSNKNLTSPEFRYTPMQRRFIRLLQTIPLEEGFMDQSTAVELVDAIVDWLDPDDEPSGFGGAEASYYEGLDPPVVISNGEMASVSELALVKGMTPELYQKMEPFLVALDPRVPINIHTMSGYFFTMFNQKDDLTPLDPADATELCYLRLERLFPGSTDGQGLAQNPPQTDPNAPVAEPQVYANGNEFREDNEVFERLNLQQEPNALNVDGLSVKSNFFILKTVVTVGDQNVEGYSLLYRQQNIVTVVKRWQSSKKALLPNKDCPSFNGTKENSTLDLSK